MKTKKGLWYPCRNSFGEFRAGFLYYCPRAGTLEVRAHNPTVVQPDEMQNFGPGERDPLADSARKNAAFDLLAFVKKKFRKAIGKPTA